MISAKSDVVKFYIINIEFFRFPQGLRRTAPGVHTGIHSLPRPPGTPAAGGVARGAGPRGPRGAAVEAHPFPPRRRWGNGAPRGGGSSAKGARSGLLDDGCRGDGGRLGQCDSPRLWISSRSKLTILTPPPTDAEAPHSDSSHRTHPIAADHRSPRQHHRHGPRAGPRAGPMLRPPRRHEGVPPGRRPRRPGAGVPVPFLHCVANSRDRPSGGEEGGGIPAQQPAGSQSGAFCFSFLPSISVSLPGFMEARLVDGSAAFCQPAVFGGAGGWTPSPPPLAGGGVLGKALSSSQRAI